MFQTFSQGISEKSARVSFFLFFSLLSLSVTYFVFAADDIVTEQNIFQDSDQDGLSNDEEVLYKTDSLNKDTDGDGYMDGVEVESGYDPTKPAPGDKLLSGDDTRGTEEMMGDTVTLTDQMTTEVVNVLKAQTEAVEEGVEFSAETIEESIQNIMDQSDQEIVLPEIDLDAIKVKELSEKLKGTARAEQEREDAIEYLTVMAYILANNSPKKFSTENDFSSILTSFGQDSITAITLGNENYLDDLSKSGERILSEVNNIPVPVSMLEVHAQALKMAKYSIQLKDEVNSGRTDDPLGKIASLSKIQGFLGVVFDLSQEIYGTLGDLGIKEIPIDL